MGNFGKSTPTPGKDNLYENPTLGEVFNAIKAVVRACYGAYFVAHVSKYLVPKFVSGRPCMMLLIEFLSFKVVDSCQGFCKAPL